MNNNAKNEFIENFDFLDFEKLAEKANELKSILDSQYKEFLKEHDLDDK